MIVLCAAGLPQAKGKDANTADEVVCLLKYKPEFDDVREYHSTGGGGLFNFGGNYEVTVYSGFEGEAELGGKRYRVLLADNRDGVIDKRDYFAITSADSNFRPPPDKTVFFAPKEAFLDGHNWLISYEFATDNGQTFVRARFKETPKETGRVRIEGKFIRYLALRNGNSITVFENPEGEVVAPAGEHILCQLYLDAGKAGLFEKRISSGDRDILNVRKDQTETLKAGGPLNNSVEVKHIGRVLQFSYKLLGVDGKEYTSRNRDANNAPKFAVYRGDKEIGSGTFSFG